MNPKENRTLPNLIPDGYRVLSGIDAYLRGCGLEMPPIELVKIRASQINGCTFGLNTHRKDTRPEPGTGPAPFQPISRTP